MRFSYRKLGQFIDNMSDEDKDADVTIYIDGDEFFMAKGLAWSDDNLDCGDILENQPVIMMS